MKPADWALLGVNILFFSDCKMQQLDGRTQIEALPAAAGKGKWRERKKDWAETNDSILPDISKPSKS